MRVYCGISFHGFGHLAQAAPVIHELTQRIRIDSLTLQCCAPPGELQRWFSYPHHHENIETDVGIPMFDALTANEEATYQQYQIQLQERPQRIKRLENLLRKHNPDLVLSNNSPLLSRAAANLAIPCFHFCSLNWADIFWGYCQGKPNANEIYQSLCSDFNAADGFFRLPPYMPMPGLTNLIDVDPVCRTGQTRDLIRELRLEKPHHLVLISMGGMPYPIDFSNWPRFKNTTFLYGGVYSHELPPNFLHSRELNIPHLDLMFNCDLVITKPGYGTFVEAACSGTPILYLPRKDWPEEPWLIQWQQDKTYCQEISAEQLRTGNLQEEVSQGCGQRRAPIVKPTGATDIVDHLLATLKPTQ